MAGTPLSHDDLDALTASVDTVASPNARAFLSDLVGAVRQATAGTDSPVIVTVSVGDEDDGSVREEFDAAFTPDQPLAPEAAAGAGVIVTVTKIGR